MSKSKKLNKATSQSKWADTADNVVIFPNTTSSDLYIDSSDRTLGGISKCQFENPNNLMPIQISRIGLKFYDFSFRLPNSHQNNNKYTYLLDGDLVEKTFTLPVKNYEDPLVLLSDIKAGIESTSSAVITITSYTIYGGYNINSTIPIKFVNCTGISYGANLHGIPYTNGYFQDIIVVPRLFYTRYIDILITEIRDNSVLPHKFSEVKRFSASDHISRIYIPHISKIDDSDKVISRQLQEFTRENANINYYSFRHRSVPTFQITLIDEFQIELPSITQNISMVNPAQTINSEIELIKYNIVLSIIE